MQYLDLDRRFKDLNEDAIEATDHSSILSMLGHDETGATNWDALLKSRRVLILAEAGSGKTRELQGVSARLRKAGKAAFFLPLELLQDEGVAEVLAAEPETEIAARFQQWLSDGGETAWFFLDSVDELKLSHGKLDTALRRLVTSIGAARPRACVVITSRPTDWQSVSDLETLNARFPALPPPAEDAAPPSEDEFLVGLLRDRPKSEQKPKDTTPELRIVELLDLDRKQVARFASAADVPDVARFLKEIGDHDAWDFAARPLDLNELISFWKTYDRIGTRLELHENSLRVGLQERPDRNDEHLSPDTARDGAQRLALAMLLAGKFSIRAPDRAFGQGHDSSALDATAVLTGWSDAKIGSLLRRALFDPATYGRVRFHHRSVLELLAAERLHALAQKGMSKRRLNRFLFAERYGERVVIPSRRPIAAWLALWQPSVTREVLAREPEVLMLQGDPESLPLHVRTHFVERYLAMYGAGAWRSLEQPIAEVRRIANADLAPVIRTAWETPHDNEEIDEFLLKLIWLGRVQACADIANQAACDPKRSGVARIVAIRALAACGKSKELRAVADTILAEPSAWKPSVVYRIVDDLFPALISVDELIAMVRATPEPKNTVDGFAWALYQLVDELDPKAASTEALRVGLQNLIWDARVEPLQWHHPSSRFGYVSPALAKLCLRQLQAGVAPTAALMNATVVANRFHGQRSLGSEDITALKKEIEKGPHGPRKAVFDAEFAYIQNLEAASGPQRRFNLEHDGLYHAQTEDLPWLREILQTPAHAARPIALDILIWHWWRNGLQSEDMAALQQAVADDPELSAALMRETTPREKTALDLKHDEEMAALQSQHQDEQAQLEANWRAWKAKLDTQTAVMFSQTEAENTLCALTQWLAAREFHGSSIGQTNWRDVGRVFGDRIGGLFEAGVCAYWRAHAPALRSARNPETRGQITLRMQIGLTGLLIEAASTSDWARKLDASDAARAAAWGMIELNGFPEWLVGLAEANPAAVADALRVELAFEAKHLSTEQHPHVLSAIEHASDVLRKLAAPLLKPLILNWSKAPLTPGGASNIARMLAIMSQLDPADLRLRDEYERRFLKRPKDGAPWLEALAACDLARAVAVMKRALAALPNDAERRERGIVWLGALFGQHRHSRIPVALHADAALLLELTQLAYELVRREDDADHTGTTYTPDDRDEAEDARNRIFNGLVELPGPGGYDALIALSHHPLFKFMSDRLAQRAHDRAAADSEPEAEPVSAIVALDKRLETPPQTRDALFETMLERLDDIDFDLLNHDFDEKPALRAITEETAMQPVLARKLKDAARDAYEVNREEEVANRKKTDIRLAAKAFDGKGVIEVKLGDKWTVGQLEAAVKTQLLDQYLRHPGCAVGCLLVTYAGRKGYTVPGGRTKMAFGEVIAHLQTYAKRLEDTEAGRVRIAVIGLDLREPKAAAQSRAPKRSQQRGRSKTTRKVKAKTAPKPRAKPKKAAIPKAKKLKPKKAAA